MPSQHPDLARQNRAKMAQSATFPTSENDGHAAITRPVAVGSATATLAARLAALPATSSAQGSTPPR
jgi:hypothetical protein